MKRIKKMLALLTLLAAFVSGYYALDGLQETASVTETAGTFELGTWAEQSLCGLSWENEHGAFDFALEDGVWVNAADSAFPVNQSALQSLADKMTDMTAAREITQVSNLADYGLDQPVFSVTLTDDAGKAIIYAMGDETPFGDGYYLSVSGKTPIYTVKTALDTAFDKTLTQLCQLEEIPEVDNVTRLSISGAVNAVYDEGMGMWTDSVTGETLDKDAVSDLIDGAQGISWNAVVMVSADEEKRAAFGLDEARATVVYIEGGEDVPFELHIGSEEESGKRYACLPDSGIVYLVDASSVEALLNAGMETLWNKTPISSSYEDLTQAVLSFDGGEVRIAGGAARSEAQAEETDEHAEQDNPDEALWSLFAALKGTDRVKAAPAGEPLLTAAYMNADGVARSISIYAYSVDSYLLPMTDTHAMLVSADKVDTIIRTLKHM